MTLPKPSSISVVVPVHDEQESIATLVQSIAAAFADPRCIHRERELILVDDGSTDATFARARAAASELPFEVKVISLRRNHGQTAAMQIGFQQAGGDLVVSLDGDLQNDPADIPMMVEHLEQNDLDLLCGRRSDRQDALLSRKVPSWIANRLIGRVTGIRISDYGCSLKVYRGDLIRQLHLTGEMHRFIPAWLSTITPTWRIGEVDVRHHPRKFGRTHYGLSRTLRVFLDLMAVVFFIRFRNRPGHFFGSIGLAMMAVGMAMLSIVLIAKFGIGEDIGDRPMLMIGAFAFFTGIHMVSVGILAELITRIYSQTPQAVQPSVAKEYGNQSDQADSVTLRGKAA